MNGHDFHRLDFAARGQRPVGPFFLPIGKECRYSPFAIRSEAGHKIPEGEEIRQALLMALKLKSHNERLHKFGQRKLRPLLPMGTKWFRQQTAEFSRCTATYLQPIVGKNSSCTSSQLAI